MGIKQVGSADDYIEINTYRTEAQTAFKQNPPAPASALALPVDSARAQVNQATLLAQQTLPSPDGRFTIGAVTVKGGQAVQATSSGMGWSSWGFYAFVAVFSTLLGASLFGLSEQAYAQQANACAVALDITIDGTVTVDGHHVDFDFSGTNLSGAQITSAYLALSANGHNDQFKKIKVAFNGVSAVGHDNESFFDIVNEFVSFCDRDDDAGRWWNGKFPTNHHYHQNDGDRDDTIALGVDLTRFLVNAQTQAGAYIANILNGKGQLEIWLDGSSKFTSATLRIIGQQQGTCPPSGASSSPAPAPTPTPTPAPVAPTTQIDSVTPSLSPTSATSVSVAFSSNQANVTFSCSLDGAVAALCASPAVLSGLGNGQHNVKVFAMNSAGLSDPTGASYSWTVDTTPPDVTITTVTPAGSPTNSSTISLAFTSSENSTFQCALDGGAYAACTSPVSYSGLAQGSHRVDIIGTDAAGNTSLTPASYLWTIDTTPPVTTITQADPAATVTNRTDATFTFSANESATFQCALDGGAYQSCSSPFGYTALAEGQHSFSVMATDVAGNVGAAVSYLWSIDVTPPVLTLGNVVPAQGDTNAKSLSVEFTANEQSSFVCSLDGAAAAACVSPFTATIATEGAHSVVVTATDLAGNVSQPVTLNWTMDFTNPQISFGTMTPSAASYIDSSSLSVNVNATEPVFYTSYLDGVNLNQSSSPITLTNLSEGLHTLTLDAVDDAGNPANEITHTFTVDLTAPVVSIVSVQNPGTNNQTSNSIAFSASESATFQCNFNGGGYTACASPFNVSGLVEGADKLQIIATDLAGNVSQPAAVSWSVDLTAPKTTISSVTPSASLINVTSVTVSFSVNDATATSQCALDGGSWTSCSSPAVFSGLANGSHSIQVRSTDPAGNVEAAPPSYSFTVDTTPPVVTLSSSVATLTGSTSVQFTFTSSKSGGSFDCTLDGATSVGCVSPASYSGLASGSHAFSVVAHDLAGNTSAPASFSWTIDTTPPTVSLTSSVPALTSSTSASFSFTSSKAGSTFNCTLDGATTRGCTSPISYGGLASMSHTFSVVAIDPAGNTSTPASFSWTVDTTPPTTSISASQAPNNGNSITFTLTSSKPSSTFQCALDGAPLAACGATVSYSNLGSGSHSFFAQATDSLGNVDSTGATYGFSVSAPLTTTLTGVTPSASTTNSTTISFTFTSNQANAGFQCSLDGAAATACVSGVSYSGLANGTHTFFVQAVLGSQIDSTGASYSWTVDTTVPQVTSFSATTTSTTATITWTTNKPTTTFLDWGLGTSTSNVVPENSTYSTSHSVTLSGLTPATAYSFKMGGHDQVGNLLLSTRQVFRTTQ